MEGEDRSHIDPNQVFSLIKLTFFLDWTWLRIENAEQTNRHN